MKIRIRKLLFQIFAFIALLVFAELIMWAFGYRPGVLDNSLFPVSEFVEELAFQCDESGISTYDFNSAIIPEDYILNNQGFLSEIDFEIQAIDSLKKGSNKEIVFLIGDSYTQGCCVGNLDSSFSKLIQQNRDEHYLNFGIGAVDIYQYRAIVKKYVPLLKPDLVVIPFYLGNDISYHNRVIKPHTPFCYVIRDYQWINSEVPKEDQKSYGKNYFDSAKEAYSFYLNKYTLWGSNATNVEMVLRNSIFFSKIYMSLFPKQNPHYIQPLTESSDLVNTVLALKEIDRVCRWNNIPVLFLGIPSPINARRQIPLSNVYGNYFETANVEHAFPNISNYSLSDYDGEETRNHFNESGHSKFYKFLDRKVNEKLEKMK